MPAKGPQPSRQVEPAEVPGGSGGGVDRGLPAPGRESSDSAKLVVPTGGPDPCAPPAPGGGHAEPGPGVIVHHSRPQQTVSSAAAPGGSAA